MNYVQYDDISRSWRQHPFRWELSPGNIIYLVYTKNWERRWDPPAVSSRWRAGRLQDHPRSGPDGPEFSPSKGTSRGLASISALFQ